MRKPSISKPLQKTTETSIRANMFSLRQTLGPIVRNPLTIAAVGTLSFVVYSEYRYLNPHSNVKSDKDSSEIKSKSNMDDADGTTTTKKVLVIPFHRLRIVERKDSSPLNAFAETLKRRLETFGDKIENDGFSSPTLEIEVKELVSLLHQAASDDSVSALYGIFGHSGDGLSDAGWSDLEEIRTALRVFRESHRIHHTPNVNYHRQIIPRIKSKPMYAYADTFGSFLNPSNKDYYVASIFTDIHMQESGELNLFGPIWRDFFFRGFLEKYGVKVHVFKHGEYKNAPNSLTHTSYNKYHRENVMNIFEGINSDVNNDITKARMKGLLTSWLSTKANVVDSSEIWKQIQQSGTFPALSAWKAGLIDYIPRRDPLSDLVMNSKKKKQERREGKQSTTNQASVDSNTKDIASSWAMQETDFTKFDANEMISVQEYMKQISRSKNIEKRRAAWHNVYKFLVEKINGKKPNGRENTKEKIALIYVNGAIGDDMARKIVPSIRKIRKDETVRCLVLRVTSPGGGLSPCETISQELKALGIPVVVSFGNVAASGGYYISAHADRIFASNKTVTGSIGVFGVRLDLTGLAKQYGITVQQITAGDLSATYNPFSPMTPAMKKVLSDNVDRYYEQFKHVVSTGRKLPVDYVQTLARGRIYTGDQAKTVGLVDEIGGLYRAIAYAERTYTTKKFDDDGLQVRPIVEVYPKPKETLLEKFAEKVENVGHMDAGYTSLIDLLWDITSECIASVTTTFGTSSRMERSAAISNSVVTDSFVDWMIHNTQKQDQQQLAPPLLSGIVLSADENTAIQVLLENANILQLSPLRGGGGGCGSNLDQSITLPKSFWG